jgi:cytochrome c-type biogenesis protein CcmE
MMALATLVRTPERKLAVAAVLIAATTGALALAGGLASWQYYLTVAECRAGGSSLLGRRLRVQGTIEPGSLRIHAGRTGAAFRLEGPGGGLAVRATAPPPDNLAERAQVVVEGHLAPSGAFLAETVLTRCASKYEAATAAPTRIATAPRAEARR